ncbi:MAG: nitrogenase component 1 [Intestinimonas sp.]
MVVILHGPRGCGFHYRHSARRRHQPFTLCCAPTSPEREIICGGADALRRTVSEAWDRYRPALILIVPTPVSDILNEDIRAVAEASHAGDSGGCRPVGALLHRDKTIPARGCGSWPVRKSPETTVWNWSLRGAALRRRSGPWWSK